LISLQSSTLPSSFPPVTNPIQDSSSTIGGSPVSPSTVLNSSLPVSAPTMTTVPVTMSGPTVSLSNDVFQAQMFQLLNDTFSKLSTALTDSKHDGKSEWPKFSGDILKFKEWYLAIMAQLSLPPWNILYDSVKNDIVQSTSNSQLNGKLYAKLLVCLEGQAMKNMISRKHLRANGLLLLQELHQMYKPKNVPEVIAAKTAKFWSKLKRSDSESVDNYYNRFQELLDEVNESRETISKQDAIRHFLFTLGSDFESIQNGYRLNNLPVAWQTEDWPSLLILCRDFYNSLHPNGSPSEKEGNSGNNPFASKQDRLNHQKKIRMWFLNPGKFKNALDMEQRNYSGKCVYHLCDNHPTSSCNVKLECDKILAEKQSVPSLGSSQAGQLRHITEELYEDAVDVESGDIASVDVTNDTNEASLHYFACVTNHYLHLVRSSVVPYPRHAMKYPIIADSGANYHIFCDLIFFDSLVPATGQVILGDGKTSLKIEGIGTVKLKFGDSILSIDNV
jgi:hypothetical protein